MNETKWIPVEERLPEDDRNVLMSFSWNGIDIGDYEDGHWHSEWVNKYDDGDVIAWMPLPEPYNPKQPENGSIPCENTTDRTTDDLISRQAAIAEAQRRHDFFKGATSQADKARRDELVEVMCWLNELPPAWPDPEDMREHEQALWGIYG